MKYMCFRIYSGNPEIKDPIGYCALLDKKVIKKQTMEELVAHMKKNYAGTEMIDECGWILVSEAKKLLDPVCAEIIYTTYEQKILKNASGGL